MHPASPPPGGPSPPPAWPRRRVHWKRWALAGALAAAAFAGALLPLQAVEILHLRVYAIVVEPSAQFLAVALTVAAAAAALGVWMAGVGIFRDAFLRHYDRPWPWWTPLGGAVPAALAVHVLERVWIAFFALLVHFVAAGATGERRGVRAGLLASALLCLPFTPGVRRLYASRVVKIFHYERLHYMDVFEFARKGGRRAQPGEYRGYLRSTGDLPLEPGELFWLGVFSVTMDPWGRPYRFTESRALEEGFSRKDFGRWSVDYTFMSLGADGVPGGTGADADIFPEDVIDPEDVPLSRPRPPPPEWMKPVPE